MDINQLKLFVSVSQTRNFSRTAELFFMTQPAVSHQIKVLEGKLGVKLLLRDSHNVSLTSEGEELLNYAIKILDLANLAENRVQNIAQGQSGHITIAVLSSSTLDLSDCLSHFVREYPNIQVDVEMLEGAELAKAMSSGANDFYFSTERMLPDHSGLTYIVTSRDQLRLYVHRDIADSINMSDWGTVAKHPFVSVQQDDTILYGQIDNICRNRSCRPQIMNYYNRAEALTISVNAGIGIAILPASLESVYRRPNIVTLPIEGEDALVTHVISWRQDKASTAALKFREALKAVFPGADEFIRQ